MNSPQRESERVEEGGWGGGGGREGGSVYLGTIETSRCEDLFWGA